MLDHVQPQITWDQFTKVEMRVGTITAAEKFRKARNPAYILKIDFGDFGIKKSSAQITSLYNPTQLIGKQVIAVINFPPKQIATMMSECLVLGAMGEDGKVTLLQPDQKVKNGTRIG